MKPRIVITGVAGFIGSNLAQHLIDCGYAVCGIDDLSQGVIEQVPREVDFVQLDVCSPTLGRVFRSGDVIFHFAAKNCISDCELAPRETVTANIVGSVNVFTTAHECGVAKIIFAESSAVYEGATVLPTPETEAAPRSVYALSKMAGGLFAEYFHRQGKLAMTRLRYFCVYGPRQDYRRTLPPVMSAFIINLLSGKPVTIFGDGRKRRDFVHVNDVNAFHQLCIVDERTSGKTLNVGSGHNHSVQEIFDLIAKMLAHNGRPVYAPNIAAEAQETLADITAARRLGWSPTMSLQEGLHTMIAYIQQVVLRQSAQGTVRR